jgi:cell division protein FtsI (penicillin-binding protein 3)
MTVQVESIYAVPSEIDNQKGAARVLAAIVHTDPEDKLSREDQIAHRLDEGRSFAWVARRVTPEIATKVRALNMKGIYFQNEFQRFYPDNEIAAQVLGYVGVDDNGLGGLEGKFNGALHGVPGHMFTAMDARRRVLGSVAHEPEAGQNLQLTIDENIQFMAEKALNHVMEKVNADNGTIVVQDVHTGQILALAIRPTFNPNDFRHTTAALLKDHAVSDVYEPGSTFKLVAYSAALDQGLVKPDDPVDCQGGSITIAGRVIHDNQGEHFRVIPVHKALEVSSDVGAIKMALKVGPNKLSDYIHAFGFGARSGVELPGETRGLLRPVNKWGSSSIGSIAIGQEIGVTPIQLVSMVSTIGNGGFYLPPHVLTQSTDPGQKSSAQLIARPFRATEDLPNPLPSGAHRVISEMAAAQMRKMMEGVVLFGSGKPAQLNGYSSGGKTGTAQKVDPFTHLYSKTMHIASFAGIAPVNNPVIAVAVVIDNPRNGPSYYGTAVSAPVFAEVAQEVLEYLNVPHDIDVRPAKTDMKQARAEKPEREDDSDADQSEVNALFAAANDLPPDDPLRQQTVAPHAQKAAAQAEEAAQADDKPGAPSQQTASNQPPSSPPQDRASTYVSISDGKKLSVPSLVGLPIRNVIEMIAAEGLQLEITGSGTVREQAPAAGTQVPSGTKIIVRCGR